MLRTVLWLLGAVSAVRDDSSASIEPCVSLILQNGDLGDDKYKFQATLMTMEEELIGALFEAARKGKMSGNWIQDPSQDPETTRLVEAFKAAWKPIKDAAGPQNQAAKIGGEDTGEAENTGKPSLNVAKEEALCSITCPSGTQTLNGITDLLQLQDVLKDEMLKVSKKSVTKFVFDMLIEHVQNSGLQAGKIETWMDQLEEAFIGQTEEPFDKSFTERLNFYLGLYFEDWQEKSPTLSKVFEYMFTHTKLCGVKSFDSLEDLEDDTRRELKEALKFTLKQELGGFFGKMRGQVNSAKKDFVEGMRMDLVMMWMSFWMSFQSGSEKLLKGMEEETQTFQNGDDLYPAGVEATDNFLRTASSKFLPAVVRRDGSFAGTKDGLRRAQKEQLVARVKDIIFPMIEKYADEAESSAPGANADKILDFVKLSKSFPGAEELKARIVGELKDANAGKKAVFVKVFKELQDASHWGKHGWDSEQIKNHFDEILAEEFSTAFDDSLSAGWDQLLLK